MGAMGDLLVLLFGGLRYQPRRAQPHAGCVALRDRNESVRWSPQKLRASNGIQESVRASRTLPIPRCDIVQLVSVVTGIEIATNERSFNRRLLAKECSFVFADDLVEKTRRQICAIFVGRTARHNDVSALTGQQFADQFCRPRRRRNETARLFDPIST